jgi:hypothetical protein
VCDVHVAVSPCLREGDRNQERRNEREQRKVFEREHEHDAKQRRLGNGGDEETRRAVRLVHGVADGVDEACNGVQRDEPHHRLRHDEARHQRVRQQQRNRLVHVEERALRAIEATDLSRKIE